MDRNSPRIYANNRLRKPALCISVQALFCPRRLDFFLRFLAAFSCRFLLEREWIVNIVEHGEKPEIYANLALPTWLDRVGDAWLVVPLIESDKLLGFVVLARSRAMRDLTWEDHDLLKTVGRQVAGHLALNESAQLLAETRQFQAYNKLTAFLMHDIKNLIAQQSLVVRNAAKHKDNPEFIDDAIATVDNSVRRMQRLLEQLRQGGSPGGAQ